MRRIAIFGPGLLGGSLAMALREQGTPRVAVWGRRAAAVEEVRASGLAELASTDAREVAAGADLLVLCTPIGTMPGLAAEILPALADHALITDVGSVKESVVKQLSAILGKQFIGSHPMAGSEQAGLSAARADLFQGSVCIVTPETASDEVAVGKITRFWESVGCRVRLLEPAEHDRTVALISHLPHLVAATLAQLIGEESPEVLEFSGPGFRDTTRVASGPPEMWTEILQNNAPAVQKSTEAMIEKLREIATLLDRDCPDRDHRMNEFLTQAKAHRDRVRPPQK